jgi:segregation and condensation protein A
MEEIAKKKDNLDNDQYRIEIDLFEGPLDLLLYLIKRDEIDIYDIPIAHITEQFNLFILSMDKLNLSIAGEYLYMASMLLRIKTATLLPKTTGLNLDQIDDPREELVNMLLEYSRFRKMGEALQRRYQRETKYYPRGYIDLSTKHQGQLPLVTVDFVGLMKVAWELLKDKDRVIFEPDEEMRVTIEERMDYIRSCLHRQKRMHFMRLFDGGTSPVVFVVTFSAMLELCRKGLLKISQREAFSPIWLTWRKKRITVAD